MAISSWAILTALASKISIPWQPVPFTLQTLAVLSSGLALGPKRGEISQMLYIAAGLCGLPVFAPSLVPPSAIPFGVTGGYIWAFIPAAAIAGYIGRSRNFTLRVFGSSAASLTILLIGTLWLGKHIGLPSAFAQGFVPFVTPELIKVTIACFGYSLFEVLSQKKGDDHVG